MKILHIVTHLDIGGVEELLVMTAKELKNKGHDVKVVCIQNPGICADEIRNYGIDLKALNRKGGMFDIITTLKLTSYIRTQKPDVIHTHTFYANLHGRIAAILAGVSTIFSSEHGVYTWKKARHILLDRILAKKTHKIIAVSNAVRDFLTSQESIDASKITVMHNAVDFNRFNGTITKEVARQRLGFDKENIVIGSIGRFDPRKGYEYLIDAVSLLEEEFPEIRLLITGRDPLGIKEGFLKRARGLGIDKKVILMNAQRDVAYLYKAMDVFAMPSICEGFGMALIEAMACGIPVVAANTGGMPELVEDGENGILFTAADSASLARAIRGLLNDSNKSSRIASEGHNRVFKEFSPETYFKTLEDLYMELARK